MPPPQPQAGSTSLEIGPLLDRLRWRPIHTRITLALGIGWMLDAFEVTIVGNVLGVLQKLWNITTEQTSLLISVWLIGIMIGALLFGYLADQFGRRKLFILTLLLYSIFTVISALSPGYTAFLCFRFLTAIGVGAEYSAVNAAIGELVPAGYRGRANAAVMNFWPLGAMLAGIVSLCLLSWLPASVGWRFAFALGAVIALFTIWVRRVLPESPRWLARRGRRSEAAVVSAQIAADGRQFGHDGVLAFDATQRAAGFFRQLKLLVCRHPGRLALGCALDFSEAAGYYGLFALLPLVVLPHLHIADAEVPVFFITGNAGAVIGGLIAALGLDRFGRKATVGGFYALAALAMLYMGRATALGEPSGVLIAFTVANLCCQSLRDRKLDCGLPNFFGAFPHVAQSDGDRGLGLLRADRRSRRAALTRRGGARCFRCRCLLVDRCLLVNRRSRNNSVVVWGPEVRGRPLEVLAAD